MLNLSCWTYFELQDRWGSYAILALWDFFMIYSKLKAFEWKFNLLDIPQDKWGSYANLALQENCMIYSQLEAVFPLYIPCSGSFS